MSQNREEQKSRRNRMHWGVRVSGLVFVVMMVCAPLFAQSYNAGQVSGQTDFSFSQNGNTLTWTLTNVSNQQYPTWDDLIWTLKPYNVHTPTSETMPAGWSWTGNDFEFPAPEKYYVPPAIGPGQSGIFSITFDPLGPIINSDSNAPTDGTGILCHIGAVVPSSGNFSGTDQWQSSSTANFGNGCESTWFDKPRQVCPPVSDASTLMLACCSGAMFGLGAIRKRLRLRLHGFL